MAHTRKKYSYNVWLTTNLGDSVIRVNADSEKEAIKKVVEKNPKSTIRIIKKRTREDMLSDYEKFG